MGDSAQSIGNNRTFTVVDISDVTIYFNQIGNDTDITKYAHSSDTSKSASARKWNLRANQTLQIIKIDDLTLTDPIDVILNTSWTERMDPKFNAPISKMTIRTQTVNTTVRIRWHGGF